MKTSDNHPHGLPMLWEPSQPVTIERQLLLAQFACAALTGVLAWSDLGAEDAASTAFTYADAMLVEFDKRVAR